MPTTDIIRFYPEARSAHLERAAEMREATTYYLRKRGDFDPELSASRPDFRQVSLLGLLYRVLVKPPRILEVPEPMWFRYSLHTLALLMGLRFIQPLRRRRVRVVSYAIENSPVERLPRPLRRLPPRIWVAAARFVVAAQLRYIDRIAFGTDGARAALMGALTERDAVRLASVSRVVEAVPYACSCPTAERRSGQVLFLGALESRKGVDILMAAWSSVYELCPDARLKIVGDGPLADQAKKLAQAGQGVELLRDATRSEVHALLRRSAVVVLLSQPTGRWREQVGLSLVEGVAHGCRIVTTEETGIAGWLRSQGQVTLPVPTGIEESAHAIREALEEGLADVTYDLAEHDGRLAADLWLTS